jgi:sirohydrochlorin cobaltochelatase
MVVVLAMHGAPPRDFPRAELHELLSLHDEPGGTSVTAASERAQRRSHLEKKVRNWPRTVENDPFLAASRELAERLSEELGCEVVLGFNEFCAPSLDEALDDAARKGPDRILVVTPMMTRGGEHSEVDIPGAIARAQAQHPSTDFTYAWPFDASAVARFLAGRIREASNAPRRRAR